MGSVQRTFVISALLMGSMVGAVSVVAKNIRRADLSIPGESQYADTPILNERGSDPMIPAHKTRYASLPPNGVP